MGKQSSPEITNFEEAIETNGDGSTEEIVESTVVEVGLDENKDGLDEDGNIIVSSIILRSASSVFDRMLTANMMEKKEKTIVVHAESVQDVEDLYYFMCTNTLRPKADPLSLI